MANRHKVNPNRRPVSYRDVQAARIDGAEFMYTVIIAVCKDKLGIEDEKLLQMGKEIDYFCDSISKGYVKYEDLRRAQADEGYSVHIR